MRLKLSSDASYPRGLFMKNEPLEQPSLFQKEILSKIDDLQNNGLIYIVKKEILGINEKYIYIELYSDSLGGVFA